MAYRADEANRTGAGPDDFKPRWKPVNTDTEWGRRTRKNPTTAHLCRVNPETGLYEVDIARALFDQLPADPWIIENEAAAMLDVALVHEQTVVDPRGIDSIFLEAAANQVHEDWHHRHPEVYKVSDDPDTEAYRSVQRRDYDDPGFTEVERNKDRQRIVLAAELYCEEARRLQPSDIRTSRPVHATRAIASRLGALLTCRRPSGADGIDAPYRIDPEVARHVPDLIAQASKTVATWERAGIILTSQGNIVKTYARSYIHGTARDQPPAYFSVQVVHDVRDSSLPAVAVAVSIDGLPYEESFQASSLPGATASVTYSGVRHRSDARLSLGAERNTAGTVDQACIMLDRLQRVEAGVRSGALRVYENWARDIPRAF